MGSSQWNVGESNLGQALFSVLVPKILGNPQRHAWYSRYGSHLTVCTLAVILCPSVLVGLEIFFNYPDMVEGDAVTSLGLRYKNSQQVLLLS